MPLLDRLDLPDELTAVGQFDPPLPGRRGLPPIPWLRKPDAHDAIDGTLEWFDECRRLPEKGLPRPAGLGRGVQEPAREKACPRQIEHGR